MLEFTWPAFAFAVVNFLILAGLLYRFLHKPVLGILERRREDLARTRAAAEDDAAKAEKSRLEYEAKVTAARDERDALLAEARKETESRREEILAKARKEAEKEVANLKTAFARDRADALKETREAVRDTAVDIAAAILAKAGRDDLDRHLLEGLAAELERLTPAAVGEFPQTEAQAVRVITPEKAGADLRKRLRDMLAKAVGKEITVEFVADAEMVAGVRVEFSDRAVDASLAGLLEEIVREAEAAGAKRAAEDELAEEGKPEAKADRKKEPRKDAGEKAP